jgi:hypothetical protein
MVSGGRWGEQPVVSEAGVRALVTPTPLNREYGMLWWLVPDPPGYAAMGYLDTSCFALPALRLVVARMQAAPAESAVASYLGPDTFQLFRRIAGPVLEAR